MRGRRQHLIALWEWAHSEHSPNSLDRPTCNVRPLSHNGPTWAFPSPTVKLHMGFNDYYGINLLHYVMLRGDKTFLPSLEMAELVRNVAFKVEMPLVVAILASRP